jgi:hexokinase
VEQGNRSALLQLIEDVVPSWMVILSQNKESFLRMEKANKKFINEFGIRTDFDFRGLIRNVLSSVIRLASDIPTIYRAERSQTSN